MAPRQIYLRLCFQSRETKEGSASCADPRQSGKRGKSDQEGLQLSRSYLKP